MLTRGRTKARLLLWGMMIGVILYVTWNVLAMQKAKQDTLEYTIVKVLPGDRCIVSGKKLGPDDICLEIRGRRIPLKREALEIFLRDPEKYFAKVQPRGALFTEELKESASLSLGWFFFGLYVLAGLIFAAITAQTAVGKGLPPLRWFFAGLVVNVVAFLIVFCKRRDKNVHVPKGLRKVPSTAEPVPCPGCGSQNHPAAEKCLDCGHPLTPKTQSEVNRAGL
ncbi:MAG: hypothetical protein D6813_00655 [Calditrichaeota bacterium]|nr:MAG: hypothetical protein D6813_00655 [Calditrichota bacterium]